MLRRVGLLALTLLLLAACGGSATQSSPELVIGAVYPLSGPQAEGGKQELSGLKAALQVAQSQGFLKRTVKLVVEDVQTPVGARAAVDRLIDQEHVAIIAGTYGSTLAEAAAAEADRRHTIYWESGAVADVVTQHREYVFRTVATGMTLGDTAVNFTHDVLLPRSGVQPADARAVIVSVNDVYGQSVGDGEEALARQYGIQVVDRVRYDAGRYDPAAIAAQVAADHPHYLWDVSYLDDGIAIWQQIRATGVPLKAAVGTSSAFCMPQFGDRLGEQALGVYAADKPDDQVNPDALTPDARAMLAAAKKTYQSLGMGSQMPIPAVAGFVAGWTLFHGVLPRITGDVTPDTVRTAAYKVDEPAGSSINGGGVRFAPSGAPNAGQNLRAPSVIGQWQAIGMVRAVWPARFATSQPSASW
jgi:branched-chain amino acid transport system substrate-binding protein